MKTEDIVLTNIDGEEVHFTIQRIPALDAFDIIGTINANHDLLTVEYVKKLLKYVKAKRSDGSYVALDNSIVINQYASDFTMIQKLCTAIVSFNLPRTSVLTPQEELQKKS